MLKRIIACLKVLTLYSIAEAQDVLMIATLVSALTIQCYLMQAQALLPLLV